MVESAAGPEAQEVIVTWLEEIEVRGRTAGRKEMGAELLLTLLGARFGAVPAEARAKVEAADDATLSPLGGARADRRLPRRRARRSPRRTAPPRRTAHPPASLPPAWDPRAGADAAAPGARGLERYDYDAEDGVTLLLALELPDLDLVLAAGRGREHDRGGALRLAGGQVTDDPLQDHLAGGGLDLEREGCFGVVLGEEDELDLLAGNGRVGLADRLDVTAALDRSRHGRSSLGGGRPSSPP